VKQILKPHAYKQWEPQHNGLSVLSRSAERDSKELKDEIDLRKRFYEIDSDEYIEVKVTSAREARRKAPQHDGLAESPSCWGDCVPFV
jgi:hypothetical protein